MSMHLMHGEWCDHVPHASKALITPPTDKVLALADVKSHLRIDFADDDVLIQAFIDAAVNQLDPAGGGWLGRALRTQQWELRLRGFATRGIALPYPPLISIDSFKYDDLNGVEQTLVDGTGYRILGVGTLQKQMVAPLYNHCWPGARPDAESVRIRFTSGYPVAVTADPAHVPPIAAVIDRLPAPILAWLKLYVGALYENRESFVIGTREIVAELPAHIMTMLSTYRVYG
jgi:uncharacterized phiE125 gp8 family phage protein